MPMETEEISYCSSEKVRLTLSNIKEKDPPFSCSIPTPNAFRSLFNKWYIWDFSYVKTNYSPFSAIG